MWRWKTFCVFIRQKKKEIIRGVFRLIYGVTKKIFCLFSIFACEFFQLLAIKYVNFFKDIFLLRWWMIWISTWIELKCYGNTHFFICNSFKFNFHIYNILRASEKGREVHCPFSPFTYSRLFLLLHFFTVWYKLQRE